MKDNFIHIAFIIDRSGSMYGSESDVKGGFARVINEQKVNNIGQCAVSLYQFDDSITKYFIGKDINEVDANLDYHTGGCTAMNDAIGMAITEIGKWLSDMPEEERPCKNMIVIMTDGEENASKEYTLYQVKSMIEEQTNKYSWEFVYMGTDITNTKDVDNLGISSRVFATKGDHINHYDLINSTVTNYRSMDVNMAKAVFTSCVADMNAEYCSKTGLNLS